MTDTSNQPEDTAPAPGARPRVYVVYRDNRKDMTPAEKFGQLTDMFAGRVNYERAVEQARKMLVNYQDHDYIMMVGDPALCLIVGAVALEYSESQRLRILRWDREEIEYRPLEMDFSDEEPEPSLGEAQVERRSRFKP